MAVFITYQVDKNLYFNLNIPHYITFITTEYSYKSDLLAHLQIGRDLCIRISNLIQYEFKKDTNFQNEQFMFKKSYDKGKIKPITRSTFEEKLKRFDMSQTVVEQEIVEEYAYTGKNNRSDEVQIVITAKGDTMAAVIDFKDTEQYENFVHPAWIVNLNPIT